LIGMGLEGGFWMLVSMMVEVGVGVWVVDGFRRRLWMVLSFLFHGYNGFV
jgi:hypothetical protein